MKSHAGYILLFKGLTLLETIIAMAIMAVILAVMLPQFTNIKNSWDTKQGDAEAIQNARILTEYLNRYLAKAVRITDVSDPVETNGYIEFLGTDDVTYRCDIGAGNNIEFGPVGDQAELAGPFSRLQFSCYTLDDMDNTTTTLDSVRFVKVETTFTNSSTLGQDKVYLMQVYLQTNWNDIASLAMNGSSAEFDVIMGQDMALAEVDSTHYLCAYSGSGDDGYAIILTVNTGTGSITSGTVLEFDTTMCHAPALCQVDSTHYLCAYQGTSQKGHAVILVVDTSDWTVTAETIYEYESNDAENPDLCQIDGTHYLCAYQGQMEDGYAKVLTVNTSTWAITANSDVEFDNQDGKTPSLTKIDGTHYLCVYEASNIGGDGVTGVGKAVILIVDTGDWSVSRKSSHTFDSNSILTPVICAIDSTHHLCVWQGYSSSSGRAIVLTINDTVWTVSSEEQLDFEIQATSPAICWISSDTYLCAYEGQGNAGDSVVLSIDTSDYSITMGEPYTFDESAADAMPALCQIDSNNYLCSYTGDEADGWAVILSLGEIRP